MASEQPVILQRFDFAKTISLNNNKGQISHAFLILCEALRCGSRPHFASINKYP